jgi:hypothetical protein
MKVSALFLKSALPQTTMLPAVSALIPNLGDGDSSSFAIVQGIGHEIIIDFN